MRADHKSQKPNTAKPKSTTAQKLTCLFVAILAAPMIWGFIEGLLTPHCDELCQAAESSTRNLNQVLEKLEYYEGKREENH